MVEGLADIGISRASMNTSAADLGQHDVHPASWRGEAMAQRTSTGMECLFVVAGMKCMLTSARHLWSPLSSPPDLD
jgi:hypothetical protein